MEDGAAAGGIAGYIGLTEEDDGGAGNPLDGGGGPCSPLVRGGPLDVTGN